MTRLSLPSLQTLVLAAMALLAIGSIVGSLRSEYFWLTPDQLAYRDYQQGDHANAIRHARDPHWRATACYRLGDYACASESFSVSDNAITHYNLGNTRARSGQLAAALLDYRQALQRQPDFAAALENRDRVASLLARNHADRTDDDPAQEPNEEADSSQVDEKGKKGKPGQISIEKLDPKALDQLWLRNVKTDPAAFLRLRFAGEITRAGTGAGAK